MTDSLLIAVNAFASCESMSFSVDETLLPATELGLKKKFRIIQSCNSFNIKKTNKQSFMLNV